MLNRAGESVFWNFNNENLINFVRCFAEGYFFQIILNLVFTSQTTNYIFFLENFSKLNYVSINSSLGNKFRYKKKFLWKHQKLLFLGNLKEFFKYSSLKKNFIAKIFIFSYTNWLILISRVFLKIKSHKYNDYTNIKILLLWKHFYFNSVFTKRSKNLINQF